MKIETDEIARILVERGFTSREIDNDKVTNGILDILSDYDFFNNIHDGMIRLEDESHPEPKTLEDYLERKGEV